MTGSTRDFELRTAVPADDEALDELIRSSPDTGMISVARHFRMRPSSAISLMKPGSTGVVAEAADGSLAGAGFVTLKRLRFESEERDVAYLSNLVVHPGYRRRGLAGKLAKWRVDYATRRLGDDATVYAFIQTSNKGSFSTAERWAGQRLGPVTVAVVPALERMPSRVERIEVRPASDGDLDEAAGKLRAFYARSLFVPPVDVTNLKAWLEARVSDLPLHEYHVAVDASGNLLAGAAATRVHEVAVDEITHMPPAVRFANYLLRIVPPEGTIRAVSIGRMWFEPGQERAARHLWQTLRHVYASECNVIRTEFDAASPLRRVVRLPAYWPRTHLALVARSQHSLPSGGLVYADL